MTTLIGSQPKITTTHFPNARTTGQRLAIEWSRLRRHRGSIARAAGWQIVEGSLDDLDQILTAIGFEVDQTPQNEARLRLLITTAADDELAARIVVQRLLPGLLAVVRRRRRAGCNSNAFEELLGALWIGIRTFNPDRAPSSLAAALISDADYRTFRAAHRRRSSGERPTDLTTVQLRVSEELNTNDELEELFQLAQQSGMPSEEIELLRQLLRASGTAEVATELSVTPRTVRNRRDRATNRLREIVLAA